MAHFIGEIHGNRGPASRCGSATSGIDASTQGWNIGASIMCRVEGGEDTVTLYLNDGSNRRIQEKYLGCWKIKDGEFVEITPKRQ